MFNALEIIKHIKKLYFSQCFTYIPTSQMISWVKGDSSRDFKTWKQCSSVSDS